MSGSVSVEPAGVELDLEPNEAVMTAANRRGYRWPTICGGQGTCRTCACEVLAGREHCSAIDPLEAEGIRALGRPLDGSTRLACQMRVDEGHVVVRKRGVRPASD